VDAGYDPVLAAREEAEHFPGVPVVGGLAEHHGVDENESVRREDPLARVADRGRGGLLPGESRRRFGPRLSGDQDFRDVRGRDLERNAEGGEDLGSTRRGRGEDQTHAPELKSEVVRRKRGDEGDPAALRLPPTAYG